MNPLSVIGKVQPNGLITFLPNLRTAPPRIPAAELASLQSAAPSATVAANLTGVARVSPPTFSGLLDQLVQDVRVRDAAAQRAMAGVLSGQPIALHHAVIAAEEASVAFQLLVEVRNKLLEAYQELMRMQI
ncbi:MAG: flagellar hook-basal body complex protein FliE [Verrucomicrobiae bacterium]|nr:flagellar hook-basal body complex protein FliE [Verrucomicrobiae bacterium]